MTKILLAVFIFPLTPAYADEPSFAEQITLTSQSIKKAAKKTNKRLRKSRKRKAGEVRVKEHGPRKNGVRCLAVDVFGQQARWHYVTVTHAIQAVNTGKEPRVPVYEAEADTEPQARQAAYAACTSGKPTYGSTCMVFCDGAAGSIRTRMFGTTAP